ncbi:trans-sulfuration enzyme family protein [Kyrpidia spormannii]|uniref:Cystathionine gamma-lyase and homocysteine gamma-lyase for reverse transsulfuration pathway n=1 Tax=Kyrpidia spormannii TaxID=2055160 RepID=A0A6F9E2D8_9BACL|nr:PLP-dependent aspartate aminotransferase family protein [Kyrpidia spormannii]CAB3390986.1 cystathionine gamma-lyase and homocysteine gamma-lyase for reverse transsulfuration pathway [Kyrpidia spormannii]
MRIDTRCSQAGTRRDPVTGAISLPIHHATTYAHPGLGSSTGFDYTRTSNPTRLALEETIAALHGGYRGFAFASGMAAIDAIGRLFRPGDHLVLSDDLYGGTYRLFERLFRPLGLETTYVNTSDLQAVAKQIRPHTRALFVETPTNPTLKIADLRGLARLAHERGAWLIVDNTFMTPYLQRPLELGADIVVESATKYLGGHNDVLAGTIVVKSEALADSLAFIQNSIGAVLGPQDAWLLLRGIKTLHVRMDRHEGNARALAEWLKAHPRVSRVYYPGLPDHPGHAVHRAQASGWGGMIAFEVANNKWVPPILAHLRVITFAESLGGTESLITYPAVQTHADVPPDVRQRLGVTDSLLRLSVGLEHVEDLIQDLDQALALAASAQVEESARKVTC